jgi:hypothetical protein
MLDITVIILLGVLLILLVLSFAAFIYKSVFVNIYDVFRAIYIYYHTYFIPLKKEQKSVLRKFNPYYNLLSPAEQLIFDRRLKIFIFHKKFIPRQMPEVTEEMKVLISSSAIQLTFGLDFSGFTHFKNILVYPDSYYSQISKKYHNGEVNPKMKLIIVSWKHFVSGYMKHDDGRNLGLHEMAHAVKLDDRVRPLFRVRGWELWYHLAEQHMQSPDRGKLFRDYAFTNYHEFFAVAVENFFERPMEFQKLKPELYEVLVYLLRQDPMKKIKLA